MLTARKRSSATPVTMHSFPPKEMSDPSTIKSDVLLPIQNPPGVTVLRNTDATLSGCGELVIFALSTLAGYATMLFQSQCST